MKNINPKNSEVNLDVYALTTEEMISVKEEMQNPF